MNSDRRPGGLTALAVINFVFAAFSLIGALGLIPLMLMSDQMMQDMNAEQQAAVEAFMQMSDTWFVAMIAGMLITVILLVASGIGYLKLKQFLGRTLGNVYAVFAIVTTIFTGLYVAPALGGGFGLNTLLNIVYPVVTLILLNSTFKEDFVN